MNGPSRDRIEEQANLFCILIGLFIIGAVVLLAIFGGNPLPSWMWE